uniref:Uncharacterized protein n=1 Tax=viral metagenome TaxID=1070528 RepID=A0A6M3X6K0_9ZZZZ
MPGHINYSILPEHIRDGAQRYIEDGVPPGGFLRAAFEDKLVSSFALADETNIQRMFDIAMFLYNEAPLTCRGSKEAVDNWIEIGGLNGRNIEEKPNDPI